MPDRASGNGRGLAGKRDDLDYLLRRELARHSRPILVGQDHLDQLIQRLVDFALGLGRLEG